MPHAGQFYERVRRDWGYYECLEEGELDNLNAYYKVKRLVISPRSRLSLQFHAYRHEIWHVEYGDVVAHIEEDRLNLRQGNETYVPCGARHRLENRTSRMVSVLEVQFGNVLCESDVVRIADDYGRVSPPPTTFALSTYTRNG